MSDITNCAIGDLVSANCAIGGIPLLGLTDGFCFLPGAFPAIFGIFFVAVPSSFLGAKKKGGKKGESSVFDMMLTESSETDT